MSVVVKDLVMPVGCWNCPFVVKYLLKGQDTVRYRCMLTGEDVGESAAPVDVNRGTQCPLEDVEEVESALLTRRGKWIEENPLRSSRCRLIKCSECGRAATVGFNISYEHWIEDRNYCDRCGAYMGEEDQDGDQSDGEPSV